MIGSRLFWRILAGLAVVIGVAALVVVLVVTPRVQREATDQIERSLVVRAQLLRDIARPLLVTPPSEEARRAFQDRVLALGEETDTRLTVIDGDGRVLADSLARPATLADPHGNRPEVVAAREGDGVGMSTRQSRTTGLAFRYLALVVRDDQGKLVGYVRTSLPMAWIEDRKRAIWGRTALGAGVAAFLGLLGALLLTHRLTRRLSRMADAAQDIAQGRGAGALPVSARDETGELARALKRMDEQLVERREALVRERNELAGVLASMLEGVVAVDRRQRVVQMNRVARSMLLVSAEDVIGEHIADATRVAEVCDLLADVIEEGRQRTQEIRVVTPSATRVLELHASPLQEGAEGGGGAVLVLHDVTELRRLEAVRRDFVTNVSHELKTPLAALQGLIETVLDDADMTSEVRRQFLERALGQTGRLTALVKDLLSLSRIESAAGLFERTRLDVRRPLQEAVERLEPVVQRAEVRLELDLPPSPLLIVGDEEGIRQITDNLLDNAQKYTAPGGVVRVKAWGDETSVVVEVVDSGIGIEEEHLGRIFERFYRVDKARSRSLGGTGLGLAIVKHLVEAHGGSIHVESAPGQGSRFRVRLPRVRAAEEAG